MGILAKAFRWCGRLLTAIGLIAVLVISTPLVLWWTHLYAGTVDMPRGDNLILLSAAADDHGGISYSSFWRARQALYAWQNGSFKRIVISGGGGPGIENYLLAEGIPREAIVAEWRSNSTRESGIAVAGILKDIPGRNVLLTSDFHMFRALRVFRKVHVEVVPLVAPDLLHQGENWNGRIPAFETLMVETVKIAGYALHGWL